MVKNQKKYNKSVGLTSETYQELKMFRKTLRSTQSDSDEEATFDDAIKELLSKKIKILPGVPA